MSKVNPPRKHHYIPKFYLKQWLKEDLKLCEFSQPFSGITKPRRVHPSQTGWSDRIYELRDFPPELAQQMEERVFKRLDDNAAIALESLLKDDGRIFSDAKLRSGWTRFLVSLHLRMPEDIQNIREAWYRIFNKAPQHLEDEYQRIREDNYPASLEDLLSDMTTEEKEHQFARLLLSQLNSKKVGEMIHHLNWNVIELPPNAPKLLTSDRPVVRSASLGGPTGYLAIPISPNLAFFATRIERNWLVSKEKKMIR